MNRRTCKLAEVVTSLKDGDLLLFRRRGLISVYGRGEWSHAAMVVWWDGVAMCVESREWVGSRAVTLRSQVAKHPGRIDAFGVDAQAFQAKQLARQVPFRHAVKIEALKKLGAPYSYWSVIRCAFLHLPGLRWIKLNPTNDDAKPGRGEHCSQFFVSAWRRATTIDPVPHLADWATEPNDLGRSPICAKHYVGTLIP